MRASWLCAIISYCSVIGLPVRAQESCPVARGDRTVLETHNSRMRRQDRVGTLSLLPGTSFDVGEIAVLEDDGVGDLTYRTSRGDLALDVPAVSRQFYRSHGDDFDFLAV